MFLSGSSSPGRATASQAVGSGFESRLPLWKIFNFCICPRCKQDQLDRLPPPGLLPAEMWLVRRTMDEKSGGIAANSGTYVEQ